MIITVLKLICVAMILVGMVAILLGINHLFSADFRSEEADTKKFRKKVNESDEVMSPSNLFSRFLGQNNK